MHSIRKTAEKIASRLRLLEPLVHMDRLPIEPFEVTYLESPGDYSTLKAAGAWLPVPNNTYWGEGCKNFGMRGGFCVPQDVNSGEPVVIVFELGDGGDFSHPEALLYIDGEAYATVDRHHPEVRLASRHCDGQRHEIILVGWTGLLGSLPVAKGRGLFMGASFTSRVNQPLRDFLAVARNALQIADLLDENHPARGLILNALDEAFNRLDTRAPLGAGLYASLSEAQAALGTGLAAAGPPLDVDLIAAGHAHIDVAWLWTLDQTRKKAERTFINVLRLMEQFPDYHYSQSQPQLYDFVRRDNPALFTAIRERVAEGRWEPLGGMWVEADCNLSGGESLVRQLVLGRAFFREHFGLGAESPILWLPDVFGYAWNLPQLIRQAGLEYFFTIKIGWNQYNQLPYDSFWWQGLDGTRVLTHFSTTPEIWGKGGRDEMHNPATYNANLGAFSALGSWVKLKQKEQQRVLLMAYGYGDGGGGPTREMNENAQVLAGLPAAPRVVQGKAIDFFRRLEAESGAVLPVWNSELYLEIHRGTYTSQARNKRANRKAEFLLHDAEFLGTLASILDKDYAYPHAELHAAWELVCLNQFHDIIPGSSIAEVYQQSLEQYHQVQAAGEVACSSAMEAIRKALGCDLLLINPTGFRAGSLALWKGELAPGWRLAGGYYTQPVDGGTLVAPRVEAAPVSAAPIWIEPGVPSVPDPAEYPLAATPRRLENAFVCVDFDDAGDISRIYDKAAGREVLPAGCTANQFQAYEDRPLNWDAWDIDIFYDEKRYLAEPAARIRVVESGPLRATLEIERMILKSRIVQRVSLAYNSPQITFDTVVDWQEEHILLKTAFPVDILAPAATYEIQWGSVQRPTHRNTSWDWARFETCAHKWVDLSEGGYGVALLNDCKYGHDIHENVIRLTLLRSPTNPDPGADRGEQHFTYALLAHANPPGAGCVPYQVAQPAYLLNDPLQVVGAASGFQAVAVQDNPATGLFSLPEGVILDTVKPAEDGRGVILRLYECNRQRGRVRLDAGVPLRAAWQTNLLEEDERQIEVTDNSLILDVRPFQIITLRVIV